MKRLAALMLVLLGTGLGTMLAGAGAELVSSGLTLTVSGPTEVVGIPAPRYVLTAMITNSGSSTATGVTVSSTFPDSDGREEITGVTGCDDTGLNIDVCTVADIPAGGSAIVTWRYAPTDYGIDRHHLVASSASPALSDEADYDVRIKGPPGSTDWRVVVTPAVGMGGLRARHQVIVTNLGPATATNVVLTDQLQVGEQLMSTSLGTNCALLTAVVVQCGVGTLAARASFTLVVDTKLLANPGDSFHLVDVGSNTPHVNASHLLGTGAAVSPWRYWMCTECLSTVFSDGFELPSGYIVLPDETVHVSDGSVIGRDGVLTRADGKLVLADGTITTAPVAPPGAPTGVTATAADGKAMVSFDQPASSFAITSYTVTANPGGYVYSGASSPITAVGLENGTSYTFTVTASSGAGAGPASAASNAVSPLAVPAPPTGVTAVGGDKQATVSFSPSGSGEVDYYTAIVFPGGKVTHGNESPITVTGLKNGTSYTLSVTATNASGAGPESASSGVVVPAESSRSEAVPPPAEPRVAIPDPPPAAGPRPQRPGH